MKTLLLLRHGKSDWSADYSADHDRPLAPRGRKAAGRIGRLLQRTGEIPERIVSSTALRARETVRLAMEAGEWSCPVELAETLYSSNPEVVLGLIHGWDPPVERVLMAGHEPTWSALVRELIGGGAVRFPTAALARIDFPALTWSDVAPGTGTLRFLIPPALAPGKKVRP